MTVIYYPGYSQQQVHENLIWQTILSITNANPGVITTAIDHGYVSGMEVRFQIPLLFGMQILNNLLLQITVLSANTFSIPLDTTNIQPFAYPSPMPSAYSPPVVIPNNSGILKPPTPLPFGNQTSFEGAIFNEGIS